MANFRTSVKMFAQMLLIFFILTVARAEFISSPKASFVSQKNQTSSDQASNLARAKCGVPDSASGSNQLLGVINFNIQHYLTGGGSGHERDEKIIDVGIVTLQMYKIL